MVELDGETPLQLGVTKWRTLVTYVPQTRVHPKGTPSEFYFTVQVKAGPDSAGPGAPTPTAVSLVDQS